LSHTGAPVMRGGAVVVRGNCRGRVYSSGVARSTGAWASRLRVLIGALADGRQIAAVIDGLEVGPA